MLYGQVHYHCQVQTFRSSHFKKLQKRERKTMDVVMSSGQTKSNTEYINTSYVGNQQVCGEDETYGSKSMTMTMTWNRLIRLACMQFVNSSTQYRLVSF